MTRLRGGLFIVKQRQSSNTVECLQVPFIERSSTILIERDDRFPSRGEFFKSQAQLDIVSFGRNDGGGSGSCSPSDSQLGHRGSFKRRVGQVGSTVE